MSYADLNPKQQAFAEAYLATSHVTNSALAAGYSVKTAAVQGSKLLKHGKIQKFIKDAQSKGRELAEINSEFIIRGIARETENEDAKVRLKAYELLGRARGTFVQDAGASGPSVLISLNTAGDKSNQQQVIEGEVVDPQ